jgi:hypothetical protein
MDVRPLDRTTRQLRQFEEDARFYEQGKDILANRRETEVSVSKTQPPFPGAWFGIGLGITGRATIRPGRSTGPQSVSLASRLIAPSWPVIPLQSGCLSASAGIVFTLVFPTPMRKTVSRAKKALKTFFRSQRWRLEFQCRRGRGRRFHPMSVASMLTPQAARTSPLRSQFGA